ncbi:MULTISPECIES: hypothetical protein [Sphingomonas]|uniref:hypothetical protein n=1 Tax=Sphingomonas TaxID=13687 RepID=UPI000DEF3D40|nr:MULTISPECIES: hypothetical protein [Sphingomonas]
MAAPLPTAKKSVDLAASGGVRMSRVRRDPPPVQKEKTLTRAELREREAWALGLGIGAVTVAIFVLLVAFSRWAGWSLSDYVIVLRERV